MDKWFVEIVRYEDEGIEKRLGPYSERGAEKVDDGLQHQINDAKYFTRIRADGQ